MNGSSSPPGVPAAPVPERAVAPATAVPSRVADAAGAGRQVRKLALNTDAGRDWFDALCRDVRRVVLRPQRDGGGVEYAAMLAGRLDGTSLMIDWPSDRDGLVPMRVGERVEVKFFSERDLVLFQSDVGLCCFRPRPYLHLNWPREVGVVEVRTVARIPMDKEAAFLRPATTAHGQPVQVAGRVIDLSLDGAAFVCASDGLVPGESGEMLLSIRPDGGRTAVFVRPRCAVRSRRELPAGEGFQYGIQFLDTTINDRLVLLAIVGKAAIRREE